MTTYDCLVTRFLQRQREDGMALAAASDLLELTPLGPPGASAMYLAHYSCLGLVLRAGQIVEHKSFVFGIHFPPDYLRRFDTARVLTLCAPAETFHPNIRAPLVCVGNMLPGTPLVDLLYQLYEVTSFQNLDTREQNALNRDACSWARRNLHRFPTDSRPLKRPRIVHSTQPQED